MFLGKYGMRRWPKTPNPSERCYIRLETCFPSNLTNASDVFKHIAFADPQCGDCSKSNFGSSLSPSLIYFFK